MADLLKQLLIGKHLSEKTGQAFEDLFTNFAKSSWGEDFEPWKPQGRHGDFKCDGYHVPEKIVFQCHGPEKIDHSKTATKIEADFTGAKKHFGDRMHKWVFIYNQREIPALCGTLIGDLREANPELEIRVWLRQDVLDFALDIGDEKLNRLFPELLSELSEDTLEILKEHFSAKENPIAVSRGLSDTFNTNELTLDQTLEQYEADDREVRIRLLGYSKWFDPLPIEECVALLTERGFAEDIVRAHIHRFQDDGLIQITSHYILPINDRICQQAADQLAHEFIEMLEAS